jgi:gliding motility-associated-like protein
MKKILFFISIFILTSIHSQILYRTSYDVGSFDIAGNIIVTPANEFVFCGFNSTSLPPIFGNVVKTDNAGGVLWARTYTAGISTTFNNIKNVSTGGFIVCGTGGSSSGGAILVRLDNNGNVLWANRYLLPNINSSKTSNEFFNHVIETSDGGFLAVGGVDYFWDGSSASTVDTTSFFAVKTNSTGVIQWSRVWTVSTPQPDENYLTACAESSDGFLLVGTGADGSQAMSNGDYPTDGILIKVNKTSGANIFISRFGNGNTTSQTVNDVITTSTGNFLICGNDDALSYIGRLAGTGTSPTWQFARRLQLPFLSNILTALLDNVVENADGNYTAFGFLIRLSVPQSIENLIIKINSSTGAVIFSKAYASTTGLGVVLPRGNVIPSDQGFILVSTDQQLTGFNYNAIRTNSLGDLGLTASPCNTISASLNTTNFGPAFSAVTTNSYNLATTAAFTPISSTLSPPSPTHCLNCNLTIVPTPTASPNPKCANQTSTIGISGSVPGYNYNLYTSPSGGTFLGTLPTTVAPAVTTTYYIEVQSQSAPACLSTTRTPITITVNPSPTLSINTAPTPLCAGQTLSINVTGATTYTINGPGGFTSNNSNTTIPNISTLSAGNYTFSGTLGGCSSTSVVNIVVNNTPNPAPSANSPLCAGQTLSLTGLPAGMTSYQWTGPSGFSSTSQNTVINNAGASNAGVYTLNVTNSAGCSNSSTVSVTVNAAPGLNTSSSGSITCSTATMNLVVSSTASPISYTWSGPGVVSGNNSATAVINAPGIYTVIGNAFGCNSTATVAAVVNTTQPHGTIVQIGTITCSNNQVNIVGNSTTSPVSYSWSGSGIVSGGNSPTVTVNAAGNYTLTVTNTANGCTSQTVATVVTNTTPPVVSATNQQTLTCASTSVTLTGTSNPSSGITVNWLGGVCGNPNSLTTSACSAGTYTLVVTNSANGCSAQAISTVVADANVPSLSISNTGSLNCITNSVQIIVTTTSSPVTYSWSGSGIVSGNSTPTITVNQSGNYSVVVTNTANGCSASITNSIIMNTVTPVPTVAASNSLNCTQSTATLSGNLTGGGYTYTWTGNGIIGSTNNSLAVVNQPGTFSLQVTNTLNGCVSAIHTVQIMADSNIPTLSVSISNTSGITCFPGQSTVSLGAQSSATNGVFNWVNTGSNSPTITVNTPGFYTVTVTDPNSNCTTSAVINVPNGTIAPTPTLNVAGQIPCGGGTTQLVATGPTNYTYSWNGPGIVSTNTLSGIIINSPGTYSVLIYDASNGCSASQTISVSQQTIAPQFTAAPLTGTYPLNVTFTNQSVGAVSYSWNFGGLGTSTETNPAFTFTQAGVYTVTLFAINGACVGQYTMEIKVTYPLFIPEVFTPNDDNKNDVWEIKGLDAYPNNKVEIYNRWGNLIYEASPYKNEFDGHPNVKVMGSGKVPAGTYFYILELGDSEGTVKKGFFKLVY